MGGVGHRLRRSVVAGVLVAPLGFCSGSRAAWPTALPGQGDALPACSIVPRGGAARPVSGALGRSAPSGSSVAQSRAGRREEPHEPTSRHGAADRRPRGAGRRHRATRRRDPAASLGPPDRRRLKRSPPCWRARQCGASRCGRRAAGRRIAGRIPRRRGWARRRRWKSRRQNCPRRWRWRWVPGQRQRQGGNLAAPSANPSPPFRICSTMRVWPDSQPSPPTPTSRHPCWPRPVGRASA